MVERKFINRIFFVMISVFCLIFAFFCYLQAEASGESLWTKRVPVNTNLFADNRATAVGDTVTIVIHEQTDILGIEDNELEAETEFSSNIDASEFFVGRKRSENGQVSSFNNALPNITGTHKADFDAEGEYESSRDINFKLSAIVIEVLGNGNLLVEGRRSVNVNKERYTLNVSGIIRPIDIDEENIIMSEKITNANISLSGKGFLTRNARRGWGYRIFDVVWPF